MEVHIDVLEQRPWGCRGWTALVAAGSRMFRGVEGDNRLNLDFNWTTGLVRVVYEVCKKMNYFWGSLTRAPPDSSRANIGAWTSAGKIRVQVKGFTGLGSVCFFC